MSATAAEHVDAVADGEQARAAPPVEDASPAPPRSVTPRAQRVAARTAWVALAANVVGLACMLVATRDPREVYDAWFLHNFVVGVPMTAAFLVLLRRVPRNPVTWIIGGSGIGMSLLQTLPIGLAALVVPADGLAGVGPATYGEAPALATWLGWLTSWSWVPTVFVLPTLLLLRFPDGRLLSPRWRVAERTAVAAMTLVGAAFALTFLPLLVDPSTPWPVPEELGAGTVANAMAAVGFPLLLASIVASIASVVLRYRRGAADERRQLRWIAAGVALLGLAGTGFLGGSEVGAQIWKAGGLVAVPFVAAGLPVAILKYRLYDIDVVITRAVTFGVMAAFVTGLYALVVVGVGALLGTGGNLALSIAATLAVAVSFEPVRRSAHRWAAHVVYGERATPYETIARIGDQRTHDVGDEVTRLAQAVASGTGAEQVVVWTVTDRRLEPAAHVGAAPAAPAPDARIADLPGDHVVAVEEAGRTLGAIGITKPRTEPVTDEDRRLLTDVAEAARPLLVNVRLQTSLRRRAAELAASRQRLVATHDRVRRQLERDLHDGAQQEIVALKVKLGLARTLAQREGHDALAARIADIAAGTQEAVDAMRVVARGIYPPLLETEGLGPALGAAARLVGIDATVAVELDPRPDQPREATLYFVGLGALQHLRSAGAETAAVTVDRSDGRTLLLRVDGSARAASDDGLAPHVDRVAAFGGDLRVRCTGGHTQVTVTLPEDAAVTEPAA